MAKHDGIPFDGFGTVIEMLHKADSAFCEKIIRNIAAKDPVLAQRLRNALQQESMQARSNNSSSALENSQKALERGQRVAITRNYGAKA